MQVTEVSQACHPDLSLKHRATRLLCAPKVFAQLGIKIKKGIYKFCP